MHVEEAAVRMRTHTLLGRDREITVLRDLVDHIDERGGALVVRGEAGIGKSALLAEARTHAETRGVRILTVTGVQTEATLPFAGLHQLLRPILAESDALPGRQREALLAAFGMTDAVAPDPFLIALAGLDLNGSEERRRFSRFYLFRSVSSGRFWCERLGCRMRPGRCSWWRPWTMGTPWSRC